MEVRYLRDKFDAYSQDYAQRVNQVRRQWHNLDKDPTLDEQLWPTELKSLQALFPKDALDSNLIILKLWNNIRWAKKKDNKYLLSEDLDGFPSMNYTLREGPYMPPLDAQFGAEDFHVVLQGFNKNLIFLQPRIHGLEKGWYVESSL